MATVRLPARQRRWPLYLIVALLVLAVLFTVMSSFYVDLLWFREVGLTGVFWTELRTKLLLGLVFGVAFFAAVKRGRAGGSIRRRNQRPRRFGANGARRARPRSRAWRSASSSWPR